MTSHISVRPFDNWLVWCKNLFPLVFKKFVITPLIEFITESSKGKWSFSWRCLISRLAASNDLLTTDIKTKTVFRDETPYERALGFSLNLFLSRFAHFTTPAIAISIYQFPTFAVPAFVGERSSLDLWWVRVPMLAPLQLPLPAKFFPTLSSYLLQLLQGRWRHVRVPS